MPLPGSQIHATMQTADNDLFPNGSINAGQLTLIFRLRHAPSGDLLKEYRLILMPASMTQETEARTSLYYVKGGIVADMPLDNALGATLFQISGHTGFRGVLGAVTTLGPGQQGPERTVYIDGAAAIKDLQDTVFAYFYPQGGIETRAISQARDIQLEFLNLTAPTSAEDRVGRVGWIIHPPRNLVTLRQDATRPFLYYYQLQFAALKPLAEPRPDLFVEQYTDTQYGLADTLAKLDAVTNTTEPGLIIDPVTGLKVAAPAFTLNPLTGLQTLTQGVNTVKATFDRFVASVKQPVDTFLTETERLAGAVRDFTDGVTDAILFPLYVQQQLFNVLDVERLAVALTAPVHSVLTLMEVATHLDDLLYDATLAKAESIIGASEHLVADVNDILTFSVNGEDPISVACGTQDSGAAIAAVIQEQARAREAQHAANAAAYRDFTATFTPQGQYVLTSGTAMSDAASVAVVVHADPLLTPTDASATLGLGLANGGREQVGTADAAPASALLRGVAQACTHLLAFPDYFAAQLDAQDARLAQHLPEGVTRSQIRGDQRLEQVRVTPGDSLQGVGQRVGVPWETLALVNKLTYPYILEEPETLARGRVSSADYWQVTDSIQSWPTDVYQGQRVDILAGAGAGQTRRILRNTSTQLVIETAWSVLPNDTSDYAIRTASNPILRTGTVASATARTLTDASLALVPESQRGLTLVLTSGPTTGERRRVIANDHTTYTLETAWDVVPTAGSLYLLLGAAPETRRQKTVGDLLSVPQPSAQTRLPLRSRLQDVSAITGRHLSVEEQLFGRDLYLHAATGSLVWDATAGDAVTIAALPNLRQAVIHLVNLPLRELEYAPSLGSYVQEELGLTATLPNQLQLLQSVERTIKADARIARMTGAQLLSQGGVVAIAFGAQAISGATIERVVIR